jgi:hypothetical protein
VAEAKNRTTAFDPRPRTERVPDSKDLRITQYEALLEATTIDTLLESTTIDTPPSTVELSNSDVVIESEPVDTTPLPEPELEVTRERKLTGGPSEW